MILQGDARRIPLQDGCVQTVVTSPPYWGLRDYGVAGQIGLEATPEAYVQSLVDVFREVRRVLRDDGTVWLNLGDSYARDAAKGQHKPGDSGKQNYIIERGGGRASVQMSFERAVSESRGSSDGAVGRADRAPVRNGSIDLKPKDLVGIPWLVAFALRSDGWYLRSDIIWAKPNPMPESVTDRPTRSHEYVFLLTKRERYYYDFEGAKEPSTNRSSGNSKRIIADGTVVGHRVNDHLGSSVPYTAMGTRNRRSVWTITPKPYRGAHFATFPPELVEPCVKAGSPEGGCCGTCLTPHRRIIEKGAPDLAHQLACGSNASGDYLGEATKDFAAAGAQDASATKARILAGMVERRTLGWQQTCDCTEVSTIPSLVFDPFGGSGTTALVAEQLGRRGLCMDLNPAYIDLARARLA